MRQNLPLFALVMLLGTVACTLTGQVRSQPISSKPGVFIEFDMHHRHTQRPGARFVLVNRTSRTIKYSAEGIHRSPIHLVERWDGTAWVEAPLQFSGACGCASYPASLDPGERIAFSAWPWSLTRSGTRDVRPWRVGVWISEGTDERVWSVAVNSFTEGAE